MNSLNDSIDEFDNSYSRNYIISTTENEIKINLNPNEVQNVSRVNDEIWIFQNSGEILKIGHFFDQERLLDLIFENNAQESKINLIQLNDSEFFQFTFNEITSSNASHSNEVESIQSNLDQTNTEQNPVATQKTMSARFAVDNTAPIISAEYLETNKILVTVNESSYIEIRNIKDEVIGTGFIQGSGSSVIEIFDNNLKNGGQIFIYATDYYVNTAIKELYVPDTNPPVLTDSYINNNGVVVLIFNENLDSVNVSDLNNFEVFINGSLTVPADISVSGRNVYLSFPTPITKDQSVKISYFDPTTGNDTFVIQDVAGNDSSNFTIEDVRNNSALDPVIITVPKPTDIIFLDDVGNGVNSNGENISELIPFAGITNDNAPDIHGKGLAGHTILVYQDGVLITSTVVNTDGKWSVHIDYLNDGLHTFEFVQQNSGGIRSDTTDPFHFTVGAAENDFNSVNLQLLSQDYALDTINSTQFLNVLDVSDRLNRELQNGSAFSIGQSNLRTMQEPTESVGQVSVKLTDMSFLTVAKSYGVALQRLDADGKWQNYMSAPVNKTGVIASLGTQYALGSIDNDGNTVISFNGLPPGEYRVSTYIVPSELTQFLKNFELENIGGEGTLLGQENQQFLIDAVNRILGSESPSAKQLVSYVNELLKVVNKVTLPISYILDKIADLPIINEILKVLDFLIDTVVSRVVTNTLELFRNIHADVSYSESSYQSDVASGNVLHNDFNNALNSVVTSVAKLINNHVDQEFVIDASGVAYIQGQYGWLTLFSDGNYSYKANVDLGNLGKTETFRYTVRNGLYEEQSELTIKINGGEVKEVLAVDDDAQIQLMVDPTVTELANKSVSAGGLAYIGLGSVLDLDTIKINQVLNLDIQHDTERKITFKAESGGIQVLTDFSLYIYKWNEEFQHFELYKEQKNWFGVALLGGVSDEITYTLGEGKYVALLEPTSGINALYGYTLKTTEDLLLDYTNPVAVYGESKGNVIHDINQNLGSKDYAPNPDLLFVTEVNGQAVIQDQYQDGITIQGLYGTLKINANGDYTYTAYNSKTFNYGDQEHFSYTIYDPILRQSSTANLTITLDYVDFEQNIDTVSAQLHITPGQQYFSNLAQKNDVTQGKKATTGFGVAGIGLGDLISADIISSKPGLNISVKQGQLVSMQFSATGTSAVGLGNVSDLVIYKKNASTGAYELYHLDESFLIVPLAVLGIPLGGIYNTPSSVLFGEGEYVAYLTTGGVSVIGGTTLTADHMTVYDYNQTQSYTGDVQGHLEVDSDSILISVDGVNAQNGNVTIVGKYGTLVVHSDGSYHYVVNNSFNPPNYGKVDTFSYVVKNTQTGLSEVSILNVKIATIDAQSDRVDASGELLYTTAEMTNALNKTSVIYSSGSALSKSNKVQATILDKLAKKLNFDIVESTSSKGLKLSFEGLADITSATIDLSYSLVLVKDAQGRTVNQVIATDSISQKTQASLELTLHDLAAGKYELVLNMPGKAGSLRYYGYDLQVVNEYADQWSLSEDADYSASALTGNILANDSFNESLLSQTILKIGNKTLSLDQSKAGQDITITGQYGVLSVKSDGSYTYTPNGKGGGKEIFVYEIISPTGEKDQASLEILVGKHVMGSSKNDTVESGAADDVFTLGQGNDTVVYDVLNSQDATGGNGFDTWTDFRAGDKIDISALLVGFDGSSNIHDFVSVQTINGNTVVSIDRDGKQYDQNHQVMKDQFESTQLITLKGQDLTLQQLLQNNQIIY